MLAIGSNRMKKLQFLRQLRLLSTLTEMDDHVKIPL